MLNSFTVPVPYIACSYCLADLIAPLLQSLEQGSDKNRRHIRHFRCRPGLYIHAAFLLKERRGSAPLTWKYEPFGAGPSLAALVSGVKLLRFAGLLPRTSVRIVALGTRPACYPRTRIQRRTCVFATYARTHVYVLREYVTMRVYAAPHADLPTHVFAAPVSRYRV